MLENYKNKKVKIFLVIGEQEIIYTGQILEEDPTHFRFKDKFGETLLLAKDALKQVKEVAE